MSSSQVNSSSAGGGGYALRSRTSLAPASSSGSTESLSGNSSTAQPVNATVTVGDRVSARRRSAAPTVAPSSNLKTPAPTRKRAHAGSATQPALSEEKAQKKSIPALPKCDFKLNLLQPPKITPNPVPRYKRKYVTEPDKCMEIREPVINMCYEQEARYAVTENFLDVQPYVNWRMREILGDWLVDVCAKMRLAAPTFWLTMSLIDRTLQKVIIKRSRLQLVGIAALSLACKMEEIYIPAPSDFVYITAQAYTMQQLSDMELEILSVVNYEVHVPTAYHFLVHYLELIHASDVTRALALYYAARSLLDECSRCPPTLFAAAALCAALLRQTSQPGEFTCSDIASEDAKDHLELCVAAACEGNESTRVFSAVDINILAEQLLGVQASPNAIDLSASTTAVEATAATAAAAAAAAAATAVPVLAGAVPKATMSTAAEGCTAPGKRELPIITAGLPVATTARLWGLGPLTVRGALPGFAVDVTKTGHRLDFLGGKIKRRLLARLGTLLQLPGAEVAVSAVESGVQALQTELRHLETKGIHALAATMLQNVQRDRGPDGRELNAVKRMYKCRCKCLAVAELSVPSADDVSAALGPF